MAVPIGQQLGKYRLTRLIGRGGFAEVYLGRHIDGDLEVAIKVLHAHLAGATEDETFRQEARTIAALSHPHIVGVLDYGIEEGLPYLVLAYAPNGSLRDYFPAGVPQAPARIAPYLMQVAEALQYAHDHKLIHRDIKPENMLLDHHQQVVLTDFGIAIAAQSTSQQQTGNIAGTTAYMAPEQLQGKPRPASDQYALGVVVYEWLTGERPFHGSFTEIASQHLFTAPLPLREKVPALSRAIEQVVLRALAKNPKERFSSVLAFAQAFKQASGVTEDAASFETLPEGTAVLPLPPDRERLAARESLTSLTPPPGTTPQLSMPSWQVASESFHSDQLRRPGEEEIAPERWGRHSQERFPPTDDRPRVSPIRLSPEVRTRPRAPMMVILTGLLVFVLLGGVMTAVVFASFARTGQRGPHYQGTPSAHPPGTPLTTPTTHAIPFAGTLLFSDPLTDDRNGWCPSNFTSCNFTSAALYTSDDGAVGPSLSPFFVMGTDFSNVSYQVEMTIIAADRGGDGGGILFCGQGAEFGGYGSFYSFRVGPDGSYDLMSWSTQTSIPAQTVRSGVVPNFKTGLHQPNLIGVVISDIGLDLYVNGQMLTRIEPNTYTHGAIGVFAYDSGHPANEANPWSQVLFRNAQVWGP